MTETIHVRGEGGGIHPMDLPLPESVQQRLDTGALQRVSPDGTPLHWQPDAGQPDAGADTGEAPSPAGDNRPPQAAPKAEWIAYVVAQGHLSAEDAANLTKADLIDLAQ